MNQVSSLDVTFTPAEFALLPQRDLSHTVCVVFDVLRATSTMVTALAQGATRVVPVADIPQALALRQADPTVLLAGEREGLRIRADRTDGVDFDLGNSPREFTADRVAGRTIVLTTTNGTRALRACAAAEEVLLGSFLNLQATVTRIEQRKPLNLLLVCAGTLEQASFEDTLGAGALADAVWNRFAGGMISDAAQIARQVYLRRQHDLPGALQQARNGRRLLQIPELRDDVAFCLQREQQAFAARLNPDGSVARC